MNKEKCKAIVELELDIERIPHLSYPNLANIVEDMIYKETSLAVTGIKTKEILIKDEWKTVYKE